MWIAPLLLSLVPQNAAQEDEAPKPLSTNDLESAAAVAGLEFSPEELELMLSGVIENLRSFERMMEVPIDNSVYPALFFSPELGQPPAGRMLRGKRQAPRPIQSTRPENLEDLAYADLPTLAGLIQSRQVTSVELTEMFIARLRRLDEEHHCVVTILEERALNWAHRMDAELEHGQWRGPLHGIPWAVKDLLSAEKYPTTWGAAPFKDQVFDYDATIIDKLDLSGAVLVAKLSLGSLAWGDVWYGGKTRNPWNPEQGSSGSSAGSAAAVAAGAIPFSIGSETLGSLISPSDRCGTTAIRPTFGRVSRHGAMSLSWSMDKIGPIARNVLDAGLIFSIIQGQDLLDPTTVARPFSLSLKTNVEGWKVGFLEGAFQESEQHAHVLEELKAVGVELVPIELPDYPTREMTIVLSAEAASAFDELTRSGRDDELVRQVEHAWPNVFRQARLIPAVEYVRANRLRTMLIRDLQAALEEIDLFVHPSFADDVLSMTNLTGNPTIVAPCGFREDGTPFSISFTGGLFEEQRLIQLARAWQESTDYHLRHPDF